MSYTEMAILVLLACMISLMIISTILMIKVYQLEDTVEDLNKENKRQKKNMDTLLRLKV